VLGQEKNTKINEKYAFFLGLLDQGLAESPFGEGLPVLVSSH
jgi:hypothetical protein